MRVLVLGESYCGDIGDESEDYTNIVVRNHAYIPGLSFFSLVTKLLRLYQDNPSDAERYEAWQQVALYNFLQELVGEQGRVRPTAQMWNDAILMFLEVAHELKPDVIVVLGYEPWHKAHQLPANQPVEWRSLRHPAGGMLYEESFAEFAKSLAAAKEKETV
ncbi:hypothetical protein [Erwinia sp. E602]|uniref:hypothetical protein n=1 Tax=Erwinia sp. E602 TaxID=2675378 RepID=UPI002012590E|nr:hypothetical protein [Erwinia sp. E602]